MFKKQRRINGFLLPGVLPLVRRVPRSKYLSLLGLRRSVAE